MKRFVSVSLLAIMLSATVIQPASAISGIFTLPKLDKKVQFGLGFISGTIPIMGQFIATLSFLYPDQNRPTTVGENISFVAGHALGMTVWALPWYLVYRQYTSNK
jgi:hypothetical protein